MSSDLLGALYNPFAAVPSLHFGYALIVGVALATIAERRRSRILGALYPAAMLLIIVATGNHFFVDAALGGLAVVIGWLVARMLLEAPAPRTARRGSRRAPAAPDLPGRGRIRPAFRACGSPPPAVWPATPGTAARRTCTRQSTPPTASGECERAGTQPLQGETAMSPMKRSTNVAARMGRWSARHRKTAIFGWLAFVVAAVVLGGALGTKQLTDTDTLPGESGRAARILDDGFKQPAGETVLVQSSTLTADSPAFRAAVDDVVRRVSALGVVTNVQSPYAAGNRGQISADGHSATVSLDIRGDADTAADRIHPVIDAVDARRGGSPDPPDRGVRRQRRQAARRQVQQGPRACRPALAAGHDRRSSSIAFGALVAAGIPLLLALSAVMATMGLLAIPSQVWPVDENISAIVLLIGLAVGVDYSMFYLKREREERAAGKSEAAALEAAAATSGRSVLISGLTVMTAMAGMFLTGDKTFGSFAMATILVVAIAVLGSLTVLPALLSGSATASTRRVCRSSTASSGPREAGCGAGSSTVSSPTRSSRPWRPRPSSSRSRSPRSG